jgi:hypothetical protein
VKKLFLVVLAIIVVALSGCTEKGPSSEELKGMLANSVANLDSYRFETEAGQNVHIRNTSANATDANATSVVISSKGQGSVNLTAREMVITSNVTLISDSEGNMTPVKTETYFINDTIYMLIDQNWTKLQLPNSEDLWGRQNVVVHQVELLNNFKINLAGSEKIDGVDCYKIDVEPDIETFSTVLSEQMGSSLPLEYMNVSELFRSSNIKWTSWITKDAHYLKRNDLQMDVTVTPEVMGLTDKTESFEMKINLNSVTTYRDFNANIRVAIPPEAARAQPLLVSYSPVAAGSGA